MSPGTSKFPSYSYLKNLITREKKIIEAPSGHAENGVDWFYPEWAADARNNRPIIVRDTDSALGRYNQQTKELGLKDLARVHGHLCDGLVIAYVLLKAAFDHLFNDGIVDRTDLQVVTKNSPCMVDAAGLMSGARINFQTLRVEAQLENIFIVQRISTGQTIRVSLNDGVFPEETDRLARRIRAERAKGNPVSAEDIDRIEELHDQLSKKMLSEDLDRLLTVSELEDYKFHFNDLYVGRGDVINKSMPR